MLLYLVIFLSLIQVAETSGNGAPISSMLSQSATPIITIAAASAITLAAQSLQRKKARENNESSVRKARKRQTAKTIREIRKGHDRPKNVQSNIKIMTQNIRGGGREKLEEILNVMSAKKVDIFVATETKILKDIEEEKRSLENMANGRAEILFNGFTSNEVKDRLTQRKIEEIKRIPELSAEQKEKMIGELSVRNARGCGGIMFIISQRAQKYKTKVITHEDKRSISVDFAFRGKKVRITGVYAPAESGNEKEEFWQSFNRRIQDEDASQSRQRIIIGDMNAYLNEEDARGEKHTPHIPSKAFVEMVGEAGLVDMHKLKHPGEWAPTYCRIENDKIVYEAKIDLVLTSSQLEEIITTCELEEANKITLTPDHKPVSLELDATALNVKEPYEPILPVQVIDMVNVEGLKDEKRKETFQKKIKEKLQTANLASLEAEEAEAKIAEIIGLASHEVVGEKMRVINGKKKRRESHKLKVHRKYLKRVIRAFAILHQHGEKAGEMKSWKNLSKNPERFRPGENFLLENPNANERVKKELRRIQHKLEREVEKLETKETSKRIDKYLEELDEDEEIDPKKFFQRANVDRRSTGKKLHEISIKDANGNVTSVIHEPEEVLKYTQSFWQKIFAHRETNQNIDREWFRTEGWKKVREKIEKRAGEISEPFSAQEVRKVINTVRKGTAPGEDQLPIECYQACPEEATAALCDIYNKILESGKTPERWKEGRLHTLFKSGDATDCNNYRPIALLNLQYKILTKMLTNRIMKILEEEKVITNSQGGWRKRRSTWQKIKILINAIQHSIEKKKEIHLIWVDLKKAYDSVSHERLFETLEKFGLDEKTVNIIKALTTGNTCRVLTALGATEKVRIERGVRQGCPLSPLLFLMFLEPLLRWIEEEEQGYRINEANVEVKIEAFADDMMLASETTTSTESKWNKLNRFCQATGLEISNDGKEKTVYSTNAQTKAEVKDSLGKEIPFLPPEESYRYLGIYVNLKLDWKKQLDVMENKVIRQTNYLRHRAFTGAQTIKIVNKVIIPSVMYRASVIEIPTKMLRRLDAITSALVFRKWKMPANSGRNYLFARPQEGGLSLLSVEMQAKATYYTSKLLEELLASDEITRTIGRQAFPKVDSLGLEKNEKFSIEIVKNHLKDKNELIQLKYWLPPEIRLELQKKNIHTLKDVSTFGHLHPQEWWAQIGVSEIIRKQVQDHLTEFDGVTIRAEAQEALGCERVPQWKEEELSKDREGRVQVWPDGSLNPKFKDGSSATYFGPKTEKYSAERERDILSSLEVELRAIWRAIWALPREKDIIIYTDSLNAISRIDRRLENKDVRETCERYEAYMRRILDLIVKKKAESATVTLSFVHSHLIDDEPSNLELGEEMKRWQKMIQTYGENTREILEGNREADRLAGEARNKEKWSISPLKETDPDFAILINKKQVTSNQRRKCYETLIEEEVRKNQINAKHREAFDWLQSEVEADKKLSSLLLQSTKRKDQHLVRMMFMLRNNRLRTRKRENEIAEQEKNLKSENYYVLRRRRYFSNNACPMGCQEPEDIQHLCTCKHSEEIREKALIAIKDELRKKGISWEVAQTTEWFKKSEPKWKEKYTWLGIIPKSLAEELKNRLKEKEINHFIVEMQKIIIEAMKEAWTQRCKKLYEKVESRVTSTAPTPRSDASGDNGSSARRRAEETRNERPNIRARTENGHVTKRRPRPSVSAEEASSPQRRLSKGKNQEERGESQSQPVAKRRTMQQDRDYRPSRATPRSPTRRNPSNEAESTIDEEEVTKINGLDGSNWTIRPGGRSASGRPIRSSISTYSSIPIIQPVSSTHNGMSKPPSHSNTSKPRADLTKNKTRGIM